MKKREDLTTRFKGIAKHPITIWTAPRRNVVAFIHIFCYSFEIGDFLKQKYDYTTFIF
jgi:hypothetical protein